MSLVQLTEGNQPEVTAVFLSATVCLSFGALLASRPVVVALVVLDLRVETPRLRPEVRRVKNSGLPAVAVCRDASKEARL